MPAKTRKPPRILFIVLIILGVLLIGFFGMRALRAFKKFDGHRPPPHSSGKVETDVELIRDWMTVPFISRMYQVPPDILFEALQVSPPDAHDKSLKALNDEFYPDQEGYVLELVKQTISANLPPPTPASAPTTEAPPKAPTP